MHTTSTPGAIVTARGRRWRILGTEAGEGGRAVDLESLDNRERRTLVEPFDELGHRPSGGTIRRVSRRRFARYVAAFRRGLTPHDTLWCVPGLPVRPLDFQLAPARALAIEGATRALVADGVGLGKTIQAGVAIAELLARGLLARALVVVPAGLRSQWRDELASKIGIAVDLVDAHTLGRRLAEMPEGLNPWATGGIALSSFDFVKRPAVLARLRGVIWDLLVVDEAHHAAADSERGQALDLVARSSRRVLLLTATPHTGDESQFDRLVSLGRLPSDGDLAIFRRTRSDSGRGRRVRLLRVRQTAAEQHARGLLERYMSAVRGHADTQDAAGALLAMQVLAKRSLSSPYALLLSLGRRLELIGNESGTVRALQPLLPFADADEDEGGDAAPGLVLGAPGLRTRHEIAWLHALMDAARNAVRTESKLGCLRRVLSRTREAVIVFTEYRDTATYLARQLAGLGVALVHGGQKTAERQAQLEAFGDARTRVLVTTDAGSEGLNLQERCRLAVSYEAPWRATRLEQRIGRIDRLGQPRRVHAWLLVAAGSGEEALTVRLAQQQRLIGDALERHVSGHRRQTLALGTTLPLAASGRPAGESATDPTGPLADGYVPSTLIRRTPSGLACGVYAVYEGRLLDARDKLVERIGVALVFRNAIEGGARRSARARIERHWTGLEPAFRDAARREMEARARLLQPVLAPTCASALERQSAIVRRQARESPLYQPGLFDAIGWGPQAGASPAPRPSAAVEAGWASVQSMRDERLHAEVDPRLLIVVTR